MNQFLDLSKRIQLTIVVHLLTACLRLQLFALILLRPGQNIRQLANWGKGEKDVLNAISSIESHLPFELKGFDCGNGSEFLNWHLHRHFVNDKRSVQFLDHDLTARMTMTILKKKIGLVFVNISAH
jgi:hypothetical protein